MRYCIELTRCERCDGGYIIAWRGETALAWRLALDMVKRLPVRQRAFLEDERAWWIDAAAFLRLDDVFSNFTDALDAGADADARPPRMPANVAQAFAALHLATDAPASIVQAVYKHLARVYHPDAGGDEVSMKRLNAAYELARGWAEQHAA